jgi:hypothetical protein
MEIISVVSMNEPRARVPAGDVHVVTHTNAQADDAGDRAMAAD